MFSQITGNIYICFNFLYILLFNGWRQSDKSFPDYYRYLLSLPVYFLVSNERRQSDKSFPDYYLYLLYLPVYFLVSNEGRQSDQVFPDYLEHLYLLHSSHCWRLKSLNIYNHELIFFHIYVSNYLKISVLLFNLYLSIC